MLEVADSPDSSGNGELASAETLPPTCQNPAQPFHPDDSIGSSDLCKAKTINPFPKGGNCDLEKS